jgi:acyl dehydratase
MQGVVGQEIGLTEWMTIDQDRIDTFAKATGDFQWIHTDPELSRIHSPYGTTIAHGFLVLSLASKFIYECYHVDDVSMGVNYGLDKVRFPSATPVDAKLRARVKLKAFDPIEKGAKLTMDMVFEVEGNDKPCCVAEFIAMAVIGEKEDI